MFLFTLYGLLRGGELPQITATNVLVCLLWAAAIWGLSWLIDIKYFDQKVEDDDADADTCRLCYDTESSISGGTVVPHYPLPYYVLPHLGDGHRLLNRACPNMNSRIHRSQLVSIDYCNPVSGRKIGIYSRN